MKITQARVRELFNYNSETGILTNKITRNHNSKAGAEVGYITGGGYLTTVINSIPYQVHRICFLHYYGYLPELVDHEDTNTTNNSILNLRKCTKNQNGYNQPIRKNSRSGIKGLTWHSRDKAWEAQIRVNGKGVYLGRFKHPEDARKALEDARAEYHKEFANNG
jgi:hypothetical protein